MANLMITTACNFTCKYCFGRDMIGPDHKKQNMQWDDLISILNWIEAGKIPHLDIHLMGGEPTLHPQIGDIIGEVLARGKQLVIFSNAATPIDQSIYATSMEKGISWVVNANEPETYQGNQLETLNRNLSLLKHAAHLTINICGKETQYEYIFDLIEKNDLKRHIKIGVSLPTMDKNNVYVTFDNFEEVSQHVVELTCKAQENGISVEFECGVPFCLFTSEQKKHFTDVNISHCGSRLDITPWGNIINCLPLANFATVHYTQFANYKLARDWFRDATIPYRTIGVEDQCFGCANIENGNCGVCLANGMDKYNRLRLPEITKAV